MSTKIVRFTIAADTFRDLTAAERKAIRPLEWDPETVENERAYISEPAWGDWAADVIAALGPRVGVEDITDEYVIGVTRAPLGYDIDSTLTTGIVSGDREVAILRTELATQEARYGSGNHAFRAHHMPRQE
jgi:hypothetical protein